MSNFTATALANEHFLVEGTDVRGNYGECIVYGGDWLEIKRALRTDTSKEQLNAAIEEFFKPLVEAADAFAAAKAPVVDPLAVVILNKGTDGQAARPREVVHLPGAAQILRAIEEGRTHRLLWVGGDLVITAAPPAPVKTTVEPAVAEDELPF